MGKIMIRIMNHIMWLGEGEKQGLGKEGVLVDGGRGVWGR